MDEAGKVITGVLLTMAVGGGFGAYDLHRRTELEPQPFVIAYRATEQKRDNVLRLRQSYESVIASNPILSAQVVDAQRLAQLDSTIRRFDTHLTALEHRVPVQEWKAYDGFPLTPKGTIALGAFLLAGISGLCYLQSTDPRKRTSDSTSW
jgi:hypothetical protein